MSRVALEGGRWFDPDKSRSWEEGRRWDGRNHISLATGSQWDHESLYMAEGGAWILRRWSQWQGSRETHEEIDARQAAEWLVRNGHEELPEDLAEEVAGLEIDAPKRPLTKAVSFRLDEETRALIDRVAKAKGVSATDALRLMVRAGAAHLL